MRAILCRKYGSPNVLRVEQVDLPSVGDDELLVRVRAASINPYDWHLMRGIPYFMRLSTGLLKPKYVGLGNDFAGSVERVGQNVLDFKAGDEVFGGARGALAEFVSANRGAIVRKPPTLTFEQAASIPMAAITSLQGLRNEGQIKAGQKVLINGASGGVGTFAVQIAKDLGAEVTGVCNSQNVEMVRSLGADHTIDYTQEDFTKCGRKFDLIFDAVGTRSLLALRRALTPDGILVVIGGGKIGRSGFGFLVTSLQISILSRFVRQKLGFMVAKRNPLDLIALCDLIEAGKLTPVIDRTYPLDDAAEAIRYLEAGHARGKIIITL